MRVVVTVAVVALPLWLLAACKKEEAPLVSVPITTSPASATAPAPASASASAPASQTADVVIAPLSQDAGASDASRVVRLTEVDVSTPSRAAPPAALSPGEVIASVRPQLTACFTEGLKKNPKLEGSVTLSARIDKTGKVTAVIPKGQTGLDDAVMKCLVKRLEATAFAPAGAPGYAASVDIPLSFSSSM